MSEWEQMSKQQQKKLQGEVDRLIKQIEKLEAEREMSNAKSS